MKVTVVDKKDNKIKTIDRQKAHQKLLLHRAISIIVINKKGEILLQQRSRQKKYWPLYWTNSCCTHPQPQETYLKAGKRRLVQELGLKLKLKPIFKHSYCFKYKNKGGECELTQVFLAKYNKEKIKPDPTQIKTVKWLSLDKIKKQMKTENNFTPWFKKIIKDQRFKKALKQIKKESKKENKND
jgi:isopentenyl-diphosphate Delta-isomerase